MSKEIERLLQYIDESKNIVFFGGAGVSTESGIPDFRSKDGLYNVKDVQFEDFSPEYLLSNSCLHLSPEVFFEFYKQKLDTRIIEPNITHRVLARLEEIGKLKAIVTQNIDGLHQKAGSKNVYEIHGTTNRVYCENCGMKYHPEFLFNTKESVPRCECGGLIRPDVTLYGENLPDKDVQLAIKSIKKADMLIIAGTSLQVYPAAGFVQEFCGEHLVVINKEPIKIGFNDNTDIFIEGSMGDVFREIENHLEKGDL